jgi:hypothetical protein
MNGFKKYDICTMEYCSALKKTKNMLVAGIKGGTGDIHSE